MQRKQYTTKLKAKIAIEAIQERETINQIAGRYEIHPNLVTQWKRQLLEKSEECFRRSGKKDKKEESLKEELYQQIGKLTVAVDWLKKKHESIER
jgi:transposase